MSEEKITLPKELQKEMLEFFLQTSIPRIKKLKEEQEKASLLSENEADRSGENGKNDNENRYLC